MSRKYKFHDSRLLYFISFTTVGWIDVFIRNEYKDELISCWKHCQEYKGLEIYGWCIMPSHVHMIISSPTNKLENIVRDMKSYSSTRIKQLIRDNTGESRREWMIDIFTRAGNKNGNNNSWQFWQQHSHPLEIKDARMYSNVLEYIHNNPAIGGFVHKPEYWIYSSAYGYEKNTGLIKLAEC